MSGALYHCLVTQHQRAALRQAGINLLGAGIKTQRGKLQYPIPWPDVKEVRGGLGEVH